MFKFAENKHSLQLEYISFFAEFSKQKSVKQIQIYLIFDILQSSHPCLDDSFANAWYSLNQLHEVVTWNAFQLTGVPCSKFICVLSFLLNAFEPISCVVTR
jgi:hypothetical protein